MTRLMGSLCLSLLTDVSEVEGDLQVSPEVVRELGVHVQHLQQIFPVDLMEVAVGQSAHVCVRFTRSSVQVDGLPEYIILP